MKTRILILVMGLVCLFGKNFAGQIHEAVKKGDFNKVKMYLVEDKNLANQKDEKGNTPIHYAVQNQNIEILNLLIKSEADLNIKNNQGFTPLHLTSLSKNIQSSEILLDNNCNVDELLPYGFSLSWFASAKGDLELLEMLIKYKTDLTFLFNGNAAIHVAAISGNRELLNILLKSMQDVNLLNADQQNAAHLIMKSEVNQKIKLLELFQKNGGKLDMKDNSEVTPLSIAINYGYAEEVKYIIQSGADINFTESNTGNSLLHIAAMSGYSEIVNLLIDIGIDQTLLNREGKTPAELAKYFGNYKCLTLLNDNENEINKEPKFNNEYKVQIWFLKWRGLAVKTEDNFFLFDYEEKGRNPDEPSLLNGFVSYNEIKNENNIALYVCYHGMTGDNQSIHNWEDSLKNISYVHYFDDQWRGCKNVNYLKPDENINIRKNEIQTVKMDMGLGYYVKTPDLNFFYSGFINQSFDELKSEIKKISTSDEKCDFAILNLSDLNDYEKTVFIIKELNPAKVILTNVDRNYTLLEKYSTRLQELNKDVKIFHPKYPGDRINLK